MLLDSETIHANKLITQFREYIRCHLDMRTIMAGGLLMQLCVHLTSTKIKHSTSFRLASPLINRTKKFIQSSMLSGFRQYIVY